MSGILKERGCTAMAPPNALSELPESKRRTTQSACAGIRSIISSNTGEMTTVSTPTKSPRARNFPTNLTDLNRFRRTVHGHDGSSRIVMVRKTDQRTYASMKKGEQPKLETITRETIETFRGQRTEYKVTTEKKDEQKSTEDLIIAIVGKRKPTRNGLTKKKRTMDFKQECLNAHNERRKKHGVPALRLNLEMCKFAQEWADTLIKRGVLEHRDDSRYGENIFCVQSTSLDFAITGGEPADAWYKESDGYKYDMEPIDLSAGHFTQVVWKDSREFGVGMAKLNKRIVVVANYYPPGNIVGEFVKNVKSPDQIHGDHNLDVKFKELTLNNGEKKLGGTEGDFEEDFLNAHNMYRARHGVPPLKLDRQLCKLATEWANILASRNILEHRKNSPHGENIYCMYTNDPYFKITGYTPVDTWYEEMKDHVFRKEPVSLKTGHFTQVVWKNTQYLGVGVAKNRQGHIYVVGNYSPAGNFVGEYTENVLPLISKTHDDISHKSDESYGITKASSIPSTCDTSPITDASQSANKLGHSYDEFTAFQVDALNIHNEYRRKHCVPPLKLSKDLCVYAKDWAEECAKTKQLSHRPNNKYGENIFSMYSSDFSHRPSARDVIKTWYDEFSSYVFGAEKINYGTLHFTQMVWKNCSELGIDMAVNDKGQTFVVANYNPRGNIVGQFVSNVPRQTS